MSDPIVFLSHEDICTLTGARTKAGQIENLRRNGIRHTIKRTGWPCVTAAAVVDPGTKTKESNSWQPRKAS